MLKTGQLLVEQWDVGDFLDFRDCALLVVHHDRPILRSISTHHPGVCLRISVTATYLHSEIGSICHVAEQSDLDHAGEHLDLAQKLH